MSQLFGMDLFNLNNNRVNQANKKADKVENTKNTIGKPELSETASSYYEELKAKYGDVEFVLVDDEQTENAKEYASNIRSDKSMIVLISENEVEAMATDESTRTKNEQLITDAQAQMPGLIDQLKESGVEVKSFGIELNSDGTTSYFAVVDKSLAAQRERIEKNRTEKQEENAKNEKKVDDKKTDGLRRKEDLTTVSASSMEELIKKIKDTLYEAKADMVMTEQEKMVGQHFDLKF